MKRSSCWALAALWTIGLYTPSAQAISWSPIGTSSVTATSDWWRDHKRLQFGSIVADSDNSATANIYAAFQTGNGISVSASPPYNADYNGWLTIYKPNGSGGYTQIDVNLSSYDIPCNPASCKGVYGGPITRMVVGGDHKVYALQNWFQIHFGPGNPSHVNRIIQIDSNGNIVEIMNAGLLTGSGDSRRHFSGITVGSDGNVYFDTNGDDPAQIDDWTTDVNSRFRYLWRYRVSGPGAPVLEESPMNIQDNDAGTENPINNGFGGTAQGRMFNLEYVGTRNGIDSFVAMFTSQPWNPFVMGWDKVSTFPGADFYNRRDVVNGQAGAGSRENVTAMAYDRTTKRLWVGGRAAQGTSPGDQPWQQKDGNDSDTNLGGGNYGMTSTKQSNKQNSWFYTQHGNAPYSTFFGGSGTSVTVAANLRIQSMDPGYSSFIMHAAANTTQATSPTPVAGIKVDSGVFKLWDIAGNVQLGNDTTLGTVTLNNFEQFTLFVDATNDTIKCWHGNALVYNNTTLNTEASNGGELAVGSATTRSALQTQLAVLTADWIGVGPGEIAPPYNSSPTLEDNWPHNGPISGTNYMGAFLPGHCLPQNFVSVNLLTRWAGNGSDASTSLFTGVGCPSGGCPGLEPNANPAPMPGIVVRNEFAANGNSCFVSNRSNGGRYWISALAANPCDGSGWVAYGAKGQSTDEGSFYQPVGSDGVTRFGKDHLGNVYAIDKEGDQSFSIDEGAPLASDTSMVAGLWFTGDRKKVFAAVVDLSVPTGQIFKVYSGNNPGACCSTIAADVEPGTLGSGSAIGDGSVDMNDFATFQTCYLSGPAFGKCKCLDFNNNNAVDDSDWIKFIQCTPTGGHGAGVPATPGCSN